MQRNNSSLRRRISLFVLGVSYSLILLAVLAGCVAVTNPPGGIELTVDALRQDVQSLQTTVPDMDARLRRLEAHTRPQSHPPWHFTLRITSRCSAISKLFSANGSHPPPQSRWHSCHPCPAPTNWLRSIPCALATRRPGISTALASSWALSSRQPRRIPATCSVSRSRSARAKNSATPPTRICKAASRRCPTLDSI